MNPDFLGKSIEHYLSVPFSRTESIRNKDSTSSCNADNKRDGSLFEIRSELAHLNPFNQLFRFKKEKNLLFNAIGSGNFSEVKRLLENKSYIKSRNKRGETPLIYATRIGFNQIIDLLLENNAKVNKSDKKGYTAWDYAVAHEDFETMNKLIKHNLSTNHRNLKGETPMYSVTRLGNLEVIKNLVKHGADVNAQNKDGESALVCAIRFDREDIAKFLIEHGADVNLQTSNGDTPSRIALRSRTINRGLVELLLSKGVNDPNLGEFLAEIEMDSNSDCSDRTIVDGR